VAEPHDKVRFAGEGDFLITNKPGVAIGVLTADCLPVILHDKKNHACSVVHAGWRGSVAGICVKAIEAMQKNFGTDPRDLVVYFGPAAGKCCYEVRKDFYEKVSDRHADKIIAAKNGRLFFDNFRLNELQLIEIGILERNFIKHYNLCTICGGLHHSYRRDQDNSKRQATVVVLE
jgi:YfiH family protein